MFMWTKLPHPCRACAKLRLADLEGDARKDTLEDLAQLRDRAKRHNEKQEAGKHVLAQKKGMNFFECRQCGKTVVPVNDYKDKMYREDCYVVPPREGGHV